ncbi:MAG: nucleotide exchange factor GrpE [Sedimentisphaerales bacterium]|nr:nucleotide exchange factor GrpE [Sedimentisphaerales bacterium]
MVEREESMKDESIPANKISEENTETIEKIEAEAEDVQPEGLEGQSEDKSSNPKKAAGEVFQELKSVVLGMDYKLDEVSRFVHLAKDKLVRQSDEYINKGKMNVLESIFELHDRLFCRVMAMEAGSLEPDSFSIELLKHIQDILSTHGIDVIIPQPGDRFDMNYMESLRAVPAKFWRLPDTVANVEKCGYSQQITETEEKVLRPARVNVYRK